MALYDETKIRDLAYRLWEQDGAPHGKDEDYWHAAEKLLEDDAGEPDTSASLTTAPIPAAILAKK